VRSRPRWYIAVFNVANFVGPALLARACFDAVGGSRDTAWALAASVAIAAFVVFQYAVLAIMLRLARGVRVRDTIRVDCVLIDAGLVSPRVSRDAWPVEKALAHLQSEVETSFDSRCVTALILVLAGKPSEQSNGTVQGLGPLGARLAFPS